MMVRPCLVLAILLAATAGASANVSRADEEHWSCPTRTTYPQWGADDVPPNANAFEFDFFPEPSFKVTSLGDLMPNTHYELHDPVYLEFKTATYSDVHVPGAPQAVTATITVKSNHFLNTVALDGRFDHDAPFLEIQVQSKAGGAPLHFGMDSWNRWLCCIGAGALEPGPATVTVTAWTHSAHAAPVVVETNVTVDDTDMREKVCPENHHHYRCGLGSTMLVLFIPVALIGLILLLAIIGIVRRSGVGNVQGEPISVLLGESVARVVARAYLIKSAIGVLATIGLLAADYQVTAFLVGPLALLWLVRLTRARQIIHRLEVAPPNLLERREDWLAVDSRLLYCGRRAWNRAASVPMASVTLPK